MWNLLVIGLTAITQTQQSNTNINTPSAAVSTCRIEDVCAVWSDAATELSATEVDNLREYLGQLAEWPCEKQDSLPPWASDAVNWHHDRTDYACQHGCWQSQYTIAGTRVYPFRRASSFSDTKDNGCKDPDYSGIVKWIKIASASPEYRCVRDKLIAIHTGCASTGRDDLVGLHSTPLMTKNRPIVPTEVRDDILFQHRLGVMIPVNYDRHFGFPIQRLWNAQVLNTTKFTFERKHDVAVWRGSHSGGPSHGGTLLPCLKNITTLAAGKLPSQVLRGAIGGQYHPAFPHQCETALDTIIRNMHSHDATDNVRQATMFWTANCSRYANTLPVHGSRLELVRRWGSHLRDGIDVAFAPVDHRIGRHPQHGPASMSTMMEVVKLCGYSMSDIRLVDDHMSLEEVARYKYIIVLNGMDKGTNLQWALWTESVPLMLPPAHESWLRETLLRPWVHYVPLTPEFDDLLDKITWLRANPEAAKRIALAGRAFLAKYHGYPAESADTSAEKRTRLDVKILRERQDIVAAWVVRLFAAYMNNVPVYDMPTV